uniref:Uncharacterized protein n=1 Tax=Hyaloperonospora arabidopsidis (strain Emoy2) TaxID=559515 RepID=M4C0L9_HYAAE
MKTEAVLGGSVLNAGPLGAETTYGKLPPLNPEDLKLPPPPPSAAGNVTDTANAISVREVWDELRAKTREIIMGSSASGVMSAMRMINLTMAGCMTVLAVGQLTYSNSAFSVMADAFSVIYTIPWGRCLFLSMLCQRVLQLLCYCEAPVVHARRPGLHASYAYPSSQFCDDQGRGHDGLG